MASDQEFVDFVVDQVDRSLSVTYRKMFGEYALYVGAKVVALVCDDRLFIKPTEGGRAFVGEIAEAPPYPGAKPYFLVEDRLEDREWISTLIRLTADEVPEPKPRKKPKGKPKK